jgi:hypothetical protein
MITKQSGLLKATEETAERLTSSAKPITYTIRVALNPTPKTGWDSYI